jgi:hypothetical protein
VIVAAEQIADRFRVDFHLLGQGAAVDAGLTAALTRRRSLFILSPG